MHQAGSQEGSRASCLRAVLGTTRGDDGEMQTQKESNEKKGGTRGVGILKTIDGPHRARRQEA